MSTYPPETNPLNRVVFAQHVMKFLPHSAKQLVECSTVCSTFHDTVAHHAPLQCYSKQTLDDEFFRICTMSLGVSLNLLQSFLAAGASVAATGRHYVDGIYHYVDGIRSISYSDDARSDNVPVLIATTIRGHADVVSQLLAAGADVDVEISDEVAPMSHGYTAILFAAMNGDLDCIRVLLTAKPNLEATPRNAEKRSPLSACVRLVGSEDCAVALIASGTEVNFAYSIDEESYLHFVKSAIVVDSLLEAGAQIELRDENGFTPLLSAAADGRLECLDALVAAGADVFAKNYWGFPAIFLAAGVAEHLQHLRRPSLRQNEARSHPRCIEALVRAGAVEYDDKGGIVGDDGWNEFCATHGVDPAACVAAGARRGRGGDE